MNIKSVLEFYRDEIALYTAMGMSMSEIADHLYNNGEICYWERDLMKGEIRDENTRCK